MGASSLTRRTLAWANFRKWAWWQLPLLLRCYVGAAVLAALGLTAYAASQTEWHLIDLGKFVLLLGCGISCVVATGRMSYVQGGMTRDFLSAWVLPVAILLPPVYAMVTPVPLQVLTQFRINKGVVYRRAFTAAVIGQCYGAASMVFRTFPHSFAGSAIGTGTHALTWTITVIVCEILGGRGHQLLIVGGIKLTDPTVRMVDLSFNREALLGDFAESDLGVLITVVVGINPVLAVIAVPTLLLIRRFLMHAQLLARARVDTKTGLLNSSTWETEAAAEVTRAMRTGSQVSLALIDIDHFKAVNDTHGHLVGDVVLRAVTDAIREHLRSYDLAGRFGGEEFVVLLPQAGEREAVSIAERLRTRIAAMAIPAGEGSDVTVRLTISVGVAALGGDARELNDLMAAADAALYQAKQSGRNKTRVGGSGGRTFAGRLGSEQDLNEGAPAKSGHVRTSRTHT
jgi:diguanylate cyclase (GGDEF)-like protein